MRLKVVLEKALLASLVLSFMSGVLLLTVALYMVSNLSALVESYLDPALQGSNSSMTLVARYGSLVPNKDYIPQEIDFGPFIAWLPAKAFDMGLAVSMFSILGIFVTNHGKPNFIYLYVFLLVTAVLGQFIFIWNLSDVRSELHRRMKRRLLHLVETRYEFGAKADDSFTYLFNGVMLLGECCGINSVHDFIHTNHSFIHTGDNNVTHNATVLFPLACCQRFYIERGFYQTLSCALSWSKEAINKRGCYNTFFTYIADKFGPVLLWVYLSITYVELFQILMALLLARVYQQGWEEDEEEEEEARLPATRPGHGVISLGGQGDVKVTSGEPQKIGIPRSQGTDVPVYICPDSTEIKRNSKQSWI